MKKIAAILMLFSIISPFLTGSVYADIYAKLEAHEDGTAKFSIEITNMRPEIYNETKNANLLNETAIARTVNASAPNVKISFNDTARSIKISCGIADGRISQEVDMERMLRIMRVKTEWRKFSLSLTQNVSIDFTQLLSSKVSEWNKTDYGYSYTSEDSEFGKVTFEIVGPSSTVKFYVGGDDETVIFELPLSKSDLFIGSPYMMLTIVIVIMLTAFTYRKLRYG